MNIQYESGGFGAVEVHLQNFTEALSNFEPLEGMADRRWKLPLRVGKKWDLLEVTEYAFS